MLDNLVNSMHRTGLRVELTAQQAEQYFADEVDETYSANGGDWKPLPIDRSKIPASTSSADNSKRIKLAKAKAKAIMMYVYAMNVK